MRILIIDFAYQYINRTAMLWQLAWRQVGETTFFGPGYVSDDEWCLGLSEFIRRNGQFDVIICSEMVPSTLFVEVSRADIVKALKVNFECPFDTQIAVDGCARVFEEFLAADAIKILSMLGFDAYNMHNSHRKLLDDTDMYIVGWGEDFVRPKSSLNGLQHEAFFDSANDLWYQFVVKSRHRIISSPAMVSENEFYWTSLSNRSDRWAVQGARYHARQQVRRRLSDAGRPHVGRSLVNLISLINRIDPRMLRLPVVRTVLNHRWEQGFRTSRYAFTCGSGLNFPIRKYFEIPAAGAVLAAQPCNGFSALGYRDGENAVVTEPETVLEVDTRLRRDSEWAQKIATAGRELVWERHRVAARAGQYARAVEAIASGSFYGSRWIDGEFVVIERPEPKNLAP